MLKTYTHGPLTFQYTAKLWEKNGKRRLYINDEARETLGYFDLVSREAVVPGRWVRKDLETAITTIAADWEATAGQPAAVRRAEEPDAVYARRMTEDVLYRHFD